MEEMFHLLQNLQVKIDTMQETLMKQERKINKIEQLMEKKL